MLASYKLSDLVSQRPSSVGTNYEQVYETSVSVLHFFTRVNSEYSHFNGYWCMSREEFRTQQNI